MRTGLIMAVAAMLVLAPMARADWDVGDPYKMHFPQLPKNAGAEMSWRMADDWQCTASGPVTDIHFWVSGGEIPPSGPVDAIIYSNIQDGGSGYSIPGPKQWDRRFMPSEYTVRPWMVGSEQHWQFNIEDIQDPWIQTEGQIYWLGLCSSQVFWNFSDNHFMDQATIWNDSAKEWQPLGGDMAFVITPEPATLALLGLGAAGLVARRRSKK